MQYFGLDELIKRALMEDIGHGDLTTNNLIGPSQRARGVILAKAPGIVAGVEIARRVFQQLDPAVEYTVVKKDGDQVEAGEIIARVAGNCRALLTGERLALNFLQRLSGIATKTQAMVECIRYSKAELVDTRKTTPGLRFLEKYAVRVGGARNHRFGLYDGAMIKDNHIQASGSLQKAIYTLKQNIPHTIKVEVEVENLEQLKEALEANADIIMLDNMDIETMKEAVAINKGRAILEASGGINETNLAAVAQTGVDFISMGALTHSAPSLDISFDLA